MAAVSNTASVVHSSRLGRLPSKPGVSFTPAKGARRAEAKVKICWQQPYKYSNAGFKPIQPYRHRIGHAYLLSYENRPPQNPPRRHQPNRDYFDGPKSPAASRVRCEPWTNYRSKKSSCRADNAPPDFWKAMLMSF